MSQFRGGAQEKRKRWLGELFDFPEGAMAIGRLDEASEGLLLVTTDGWQSHVVRGRGVEKEYYAQVDGLVTDEALAQLRAGVEISVDGAPYRTLPGRAELLDPPPALGPRGRKIRDERHGPTSWLTITVTEGKFRQVRKMTAAVGLPTLRLVRVRIGHLHLGALPAGGVLEVPDFGFPASERPAEPA